jgi:hypothetical protein
MRGVWVMAITCGLLAGGAVAGVVHAHHGWGEFDEQQRQTVTGIIRQSSYEHPHGELRLETDSATWRVILAPPSRMRARGLSKALLAPGTRATVAGLPSRKTRHEMRAERITIGGKTVELR